MNTPAVRLHNVSRTFGTTTVLSAVDLFVAPGERWAVVGPSGSGKTTLLRLIAGLDLPTTGEIGLDGRDVSAANRILIPPERREVAMVFQGLALFPHLNALDQIAFAARDRGGRAEAQRLLDRLALGHRAKASLDQLSGGERQRIALARALAQRPKVILMDEPFASLDEERRAEMRALLRSLLDESHATLMLVTHARDDAFDLADHVLVLDRGVAVVSGGLSDICVSPQHVAAVRSLGLGQIVQGHTTDGITAATAFGPVTFPRPVPIGSVRLLVRSAQPQISTTGVEVDVVSIELRPPETESRVRRFAMVRADTEMLRIELFDDSIRAGERTRVTIEGPCMPIAG